MGRARFLIALVGALVMSAGAPAQACSPLWAKGAGMHWETVYVARVVSVNRLLGRVQVERIRAVKGEAPERETLRYDNEPFFCGMQSFSRGQAVFVFGDERELRFVTEPDYVDDPFLHSLMPAGAK